MGLIVDAGFDTEGLQSHCSENEIIGKIGQNKRNGAEPKQVSNPVWAVKSYLLRSLISKNHGGLVENNTQHLKTLLSNTN